METSRKSTLTWGVILILVGLIVLVFQFYPDLWSVLGEGTWPLIVVAAGIGLAIIGLLTGVPGMAVPACIVTGIGGLLYWQNATGNWGSWAYAWALIPGFAGVGVMLTGLLEGKGSTVRDGAWTTLVSLVMFAIFASFLGGPRWLGRYWPVLLIVLGIVSLARYYLEARRK